ncbi:MAG: inositol monophosphatase [Opitutae bacterium]|nr:inositol monophosphatase [Opitutae bacterium]
MDGQEQRIAAAREVVRGKIEYFKQNFSRVESHWKADKTRVTDADMTLSRTITAEILQKFPGDDFCSEEELPPAGTTKKFDAEFAWVLDPIDGTNNFARGIPLCAISLALLRRGMPVYGIIYDHAQNSILEGGESVPLTKNGIVVEVPPELPFDANSLISLHFPLSTRDSRALEPLTRVNALRCQGSAALNLAYNAFGAIDGSIDHFTRVWDIAAACAMLAAVGKRIIFTGANPFPLREISYDMPKLRWFAGTKAFLDKAESLGII